MSVSPFYFRYLKLISKIVGTLPRIRDLRHATSRQFIFLLLMISLLVFAACDNAGEPIVPEPGDVKMVEHYASDDTLAVERGIDAVPESDGIYLAWYSLRDPNINQYNIYRKKENGTFFQRIKSIDLETATAGRDTTYIDDNAEAGLTLNTDYYYFVTATNKNGKEGSTIDIDTLHYMLIDKPELLSSDKETYDPNVDGLPVLFWSFVNIPDLYILRIENDFDQVHYIGIFRSNYDPDYQQTLDLSSIQDFPAFKPGGYKWRIDSIGPDEDHSGAESEWNFFIIEQPG